MMRSLIVFGFFIAMTAAFGDKDKQEIKQWTMMKAMESCLGEDLVKMYFKKIKKAASKCHKIDAPELDLPMFRDPFGFANALVEPTAETKSIDDLMERYIQIEMLKRLRNPRNRYRRQALDVEDVEDEEEEAVETDEDDDMEKMELGKRLTKKLLKKKRQIEQKNSNMTCVLRELGYLDDNNDFNEEHLEKMGEEFPIADPWLKDELHEGCKLCRQFQKAVPQEFYDKCEHEEGVGRVMVYKKCFKMHKIKTCMKYDLKKKIESSFGPIEDVVKETGLEENDLYAAFKQLMSGPEKMLF